jgi:hypothetical protein
MNGFFSEAKSLLVQLCCDRGPSTAKGRIPKGRPLIVQRPPPSSNPISHPVHDFGEVGEIGGQVDSLQQELLLLTA